MRPQPDLLVFSSGLFITGDMLRIAKSDAELAGLMRQHNKVPVTRAHHEFAAALEAAMSAARQSDIGESVVLKNIPRVQPTIPVNAAAARLGLSERQTQRLAPKLGGKIIAGRWFLDDDAVAAHLEGRDC